MIVLEVTLRLVLHLEKLTDSIFIPTKPAQIVAVGADGSGFTDLSHNGRFNRDPAWSKDGNWIAFVSGGCQSPFLPCLEANHEVYVMRKEGSGAVKLTHGVKWAAFPEWSP